jgi:hypothetical protein
MQGLPGDDLCGQSIVFGLHQIYSTGDPHLAREEKGGSWEKGEF